MKTYQRLRKREVYRNPYLAVEAHEIVHPSGTAGEHVLVVTPRCSAVVISDGGDLLFARQPRFAAQSEVVEIVKGGADEGESALECAQRETREELGLAAMHWEHIGRLYEVPSIIGEPVELFVARGVEHVDVENEPIESVELVRIPQEIAIRAAAEGRINDAITVAALLRYGVHAGVIALPTMAASS